MSSTLELADVYVSFIPTMQGSRATIASQIVPAAESAGEEAGDAAGDGFSGKFQLAAGAAAAAAGALFVDGFMKNLELEGSTNKVAASMGLSEDQSKRAGEIAGSLWSSGYGESLEDVSTAVGDVMGSIEGMRDASAPELEALTQKAISFATAMDTDVATAAGTASLLINNGLAKDGVEAFDLLTAASQKVPASMREDISAASQEYGTFFSSLGFSGEEMFTALVDGSKNGIIGIDKAGDAIKEFTIRATDGSASTGEALEGIGLNAGDMANAILAGGDSARGATQAIVDGLLGIEDPAAQSAAAIALFGTPLEDMNTAEIPAFLDSLSNMSGGLGDVEGSAGRLDSTLNSGAASGIETLKRSFQGAFMEMSEDLLPAVTTFTDWAAENPGVVKAVAYGVSALAVALGIAAAAQWVMNSALLANPMTWIIVGIVALVAALVLLIANWDSVVAFLKDVWAGVVDWLSGVWTSITDGIATAWSAISTYFSGLWAEIKTGFETGWTTILDFFKQIPGWMLGAFLDFTLIGLLIGHWDTISKGAKGAWNALVDWIKGVPGRFVSGLSSLGNLAGTVGGWVADATQGARNKFGELLTYVGNVPGNVLSALGNTGTLLKDAGVQIITGFYNGLKQKFEDVKNWVGGVGSWIADHKGPKAYDLELLRPAGGWIMTGLQRGLAEQIPALRSTLGDVTDAITLNASVKAPNLGPNYAAAAMDNTFAGTGSDRGGVNVTVNETSDPRATATAVVRHLSMEGV